MIYYFEMDEQFIYSKSRFYRYVLPINKIQLRDLPKSLLYGSNRAWSWDQKTNEVKFVKNRYTGTMTAVDMKEFLLVQLQAKDYEDRF